jgi:transcriptional regulator with XRE-family HTH domain
MNLSFGARLRLQREKRGIALIDIANQTKIKRSLLDALERDDLSCWPHGIFGRAYIRSYAQAVGLATEPVIREFLDLHPEPVDELTTEEASGDAPRRLSMAIGSAFGAIFLGRTTDRRESHITLEAPVSRRPKEPPMAPRPAELTAVAALCRRLQLAEGADDVEGVLGDIAHTLDAVGLVLWSWDSTVAALKPWLTHGYPDQVIAHFPCVRRDEDNAIAAAFESAKTCTVHKGSGDTGAVVVPLIVSGRCVGVLSVELRDGGERRESTGDAAAILGSLLARFVDQHQDEAARPVVNAVLIA